MLEGIGYYITSASGEDQSTLVWTGSGFDLTDHIPFWPTWEHETDARRQFELACDAAKDMGLPFVMLQCMDDGGDWVIEEKSLS